MMRDLWDLRDSQGVSDVTEVKLLPDSLLEVKKSWSGSSWSALVLFKHTVVAGNVTLVIDACEHKKEEENIHLLF